MQWRAVIYWIESMIGVDSLSHSFMSALIRFCSSSHFCLLTPSGVSSSGVSHPRGFPCRGTFPDSNTGPMLQSSIHSRMWTILPGDLLITAFHNPGYLASVERYLYSQRQTIPLNVGIPQCSVLTINIHLWGSLVVSHRHSFWVQLDILNAYLFNFDLLVSSMSKFQVQILFPNSPTRNTFPFWEISEKCIRSGSLNKTLLFLETNSRNWDSEPYQWDPPSVRVVCLWALYIYNINTHYSSLLGSPMK